MFSGIIKHTGTVQSLTPTGTNLRLTAASPLAASLHTDQSVAHDGVSLTVVLADATTYTVDIVRETLSKTRLGRLQPGDEINLETSITPQTLLDGHIVQGHVDTVLTCLSMTDQNGSWTSRFGLPQEHAGLVIPRGSICLNGVSLTVANVYPDSFDVAIIPYTYDHTNFRLLKPGDQVNAEFDVLGKYIRRQLDLQGS